MGMILGCSTPYTTELQWVLAFRINLYTEKNMVPQAPRQCPTPQTHRLILD